MQQFDTGGKNPVRRQKSWRNALGICLAVFVLAAAAASACSIPVFRYALTRWRATPYVAAVVHEKPLSEDDRAVISYLKKQVSERDTPPNLRVKKLNVKKNKKARKRLEPDSTPSIMLIHPQLPPDHRVVWQAPIKKKAVDRMVQSPVRKKLAQRLLDGHAAVWLLLESGNKQKDRQARKTLKTRLEKMEEMVRLPMGYNPPGQSSGSGGDKKGGKKEVNFSMLRLDRSDPQEKALVSILLHSEPGLTKDKYRDDPMAFPVFGRGRVLYGLVGEGINKSNIARVSAFLVGGCQCQVKSAAPGKDLLISADWSSVAYGRGPGGAPPSVQGALGGRGSGKKGSGGSGGGR